MSFLFNRSSKVRRVTFRATANIQVGETLCVVGDTPRLGNGAVKHALELVTSPKDFPVWFNSNPVSIPASKTVQYKYFIRAGGKFKRWEPFEGHRTLAPHEKGTALDVYIHDTVDLPAGDKAAASEQRPAGDGGAGEGTTITAVLSPHNSPVLRARSSAKLPPSPARIESLEAATSPSGSTTTSHSGSDLEELQLDQTDAVICVQFYLPVLVERNTAYEEEVAVAAAAHQSAPAIAPRPPRKYHIKRDMDSLFARQKATQADHMRVLFVGTLRIKVPEEDQEYVSQALKPFRCVPVFLPERVYDLCLTFIHQTLWPIFHNVVDIYGALPTLWWNGNVQERHWESYMTMNQLFASKIVEVFCSGDLVWIQDTGCLILPSFLVRKIQDLHIGMFIHKTFPSSEIFRTISTRADLLRGMLNANQIGFHLYEYARHFLTCCRRILGLKMRHERGGGMVVEYQGRDVKVTVAHASVEPTVILSRLKEPKCAEHVAEFERVLGLRQQKRRVIIGVDRLERMCGMVIKLGAFGEFLDANPSYIGRCCLVQYGIHAPTRGEDYVETRQKVLALVAKINRDTTGREDGGIAPTILYREVDRANVLERAALYKVADVMLNSCIRQGFDMIPLEYVAANPGGILAMSEFACCSRVLTGSVVFNPFLTEEVANVILRCLTMDRNEQRLRYEQNNAFVMSNNTSAWAEKVLTELKRGRRQVRSKEYIGHGFGLGFKRMGVNSDFRRLNQTRVVQSYAAAKNRIILLDVGGTITTAANVDALSMFARAKNQESGLLSHTLDAARRPTKEVLAALSNLANDKRNTVFLLSGEKRRVLEAVIGDIGQNNIGLAAEHGYTYKWCTAGGPTVGPDTTPEKTRLKNVTMTTAPWQTSDDMFDDSWKVMVKEIMSIYTMRTTGSYIDQKGSAVIWRFQDCDQDFGVMQANELHTHLSENLKSFQVQIIFGKEHVEVRPKGVDKGAMVARILAWAGQKKAPIDFVLCCGDEQDDEFMFQKVHAVLGEDAPGGGEGEDVSASGDTPAMANNSDGGRGGLGMSKGSIGRGLHSMGAPLPSLGPKLVPGRKNQPDIFCATVGAKPSKARYFVHSSDDVGEMLVALGKVSSMSSRTPRSRSMNDLRLLGRRRVPRTVPTRDSSDSDTGSSYAGSDVFDEAASVGPVTAPAADSRQQRRTTSFTSGFIGGGFHSRTAFGTLAEKRRQASASMVNLASLSSDKKDQISTIMAPIMDASRAQNLDEYFDHLAEPDEEEGGGIFF